MQNKKIYFDCETTGLDKQKNDIIQIAGAIEVNEIIVESFNFRMQPLNWDDISEQAILTHGISREDMKTYSTPKIIYSQLLALFDKYIDKFDRQDRFIVCGYNVRFDIDFLNSFFIKNNNPYLFSYFGDVKDPFPVIQYLKALGKIDTPDLKLTTICKSMGIEIENAHDADSDILATIKVIKKIDELFL